MGPKERRVVDDAGQGGAKERKVRGGDISVRSTGVSRLLSLPGSREEEAESPREGAPQK